MLSDEKQPDQKKTASKLLPRKYKLVFFLTVMKKEEKFEAES